MTLVFQYYISAFNHYLHVTEKELHTLMNADDRRQLLGTNSGQRFLDAHYDEIMTIRKDLNISAIDVEDAMYISAVNLLFPITYIGKMYFILKRGNMDLKNLFGPQFVLDLLTFAAVLAWVIWWIMLFEPLPDNKYLNAFPGVEFTTMHEIFMLNVIT